MTFFQIRVANYWEALGVMAAHKAGVDPFSLRRFGVKHIETNVNALGRMAVSV